MSYEVEVKYRGVDHERLIRRLDELGAKSAGRVEQEDSYMNHPARDFADTGEAFRIRRTGPDNRITYKGPKLGGPTKTREEIELSFGEGPEHFEELRRLFDVLGFRTVAVIRKRREIFWMAFQGRLLEIAVDRAEGLGDFAEIEAIVGGEADLPSAQQAVLELAEQLGLTDIEPRSYLRMHLESLERS